MKSITYYNGMISESGETKIPSSDRAFYFGDAVYEAGCGRGGRMYLYEEHIKRLFKSADAIGISSPFSSSQIRKIIRSLAEKSEAAEHEVYFIYIQLSRGCAPRAHVYEENIHPSLYITLTPTSLPDFHKPIKLMSTPDIRYSMCNIKTTNLLPNILAAKMADKNGCNEAVFIRDGKVTECAHSNISFLCNGQLFTHPKDSLILGGIAMEHLRQAAVNLGIQHREKVFSYEEMLDADEIIVTSSSKFALRVESIDGKSVGGRDMTRFSLLQNYVTNEFFNAK